MKFTEKYPDPAFMNHDAVSQIPIEYEFAPNDFGDDWQELEVLECEKCHAQVVGDFTNSNSSHGDYDDYSGEDPADCDGTLIGSDGPMMNFIYPLPGIELTEAYKAAKKIDGLNLCIIWQPMMEKCGMALTGAGMDFFWEICEAYMRLGYVPPYHFANDMPCMAEPLTETKRWVIEGCRESIRTMQLRAERAMQRLDEVEDFYAKR